ncbi:MAG TPA: winged helix-turn-helix domain-containing protein [Polyangiaceae bacterium]|nr:winged helix-turn-helix domain-containing protein [Polyangiaceae bacterium]
MPEGDGVGRFAFGPFVLIPDRQLLLENGAPVRIGGRALDLLKALVQRQGDVVSKRQLMSQAWPDLAVDEGNIKVNIAALRRVLCDDSGQPRYIATEVGRGYRFIAPVRLSEPCPARPPADAPSERVGQLPPCATRIFGRTAAITSIARELGSSGLVSIVGPGGVGKTTVALAVAHAAASSFDDGAWFVDLAALADPSLVPAAIARGLGLNAERGSESSALHQHLLTRQVLLVLDNCEHLIDAVASCADRLLANARRLALLTTSRESLCIKGERVRRLSGSSTPPASSRIGAADALEYAAVQLFVDRATRQRASFTLSHANAPVVAEICRRTEGLPLAIECIAARIDSLDVDEMLAHVDSGAYLHDASLDRPDRHRTLSATLDGSYRLLSGSEQALMRRLSIFGGSFTLEAACVVGVSDGVTPDSVVDDVANLAAKSLLVAEPREGGMSYRQPHVARVFALEKLVASGELERVRRRHTRHLLQLAEQAAAEHDRLCDSCARRRRSRPSTDR